MKKAAGIGAIIAVIVGVIIVSASVSMDPTDKTELGLEDVVEVEVVEESEEVVEESEEVVEEEGRDLSVEFTESIGLTTP